MVITTLHVEKVSVDNTDTGKYFNLNYDYGIVVDEMSTEEFSAWYQGKKAYEKACLRILENAEKVEKDAMDILREAQEA